MLAELGVGAGAILATGGVLRGAWVTVRGGYRLMRKIDSTFHAAQELLPNHGNSIKDRVDVFAEDIPEIRQMIAGHIADVEAHRRAEP